MLCEAAAPYNISRHQGPGEVVRGVEGSRPSAEADAFAAGTGGASGAEGGRPQPKMRFYWRGHGPADNSADLMFSLTNGKPLTPEAMRELIEMADEDKFRRAMGG